MDEPKKYEFIKHLVSIAGFVLNVALLTYLVTSGWSVRIRSFSESLVSPEWAVVLVYVLVVGAIFKLVQLPLDLYSSYYVEHRFGLSRQSLAGWIIDEVKSLAIAVPLSAGAVEVIYYLLRTYPVYWWIYAGLAVITFGVVMANLAPVLLLPLFFKFKPIDNEDLEKRVNRLSRRTDTKVCGVFEWSLGEKTRKANAAVVGWGNTRRIIVSDTLLKSFSGEEIEVIMAHELCHHVKNHIWQGMALQSVLTFAAFYAAHRILPPLSRTFGFRAVSDIAGLPLLVLTVTCLSLLVLPAVNGFSRRLETAADLYALDITGDSLAFVSSMEKLAELNLTNKNPNPIVEFLFYSHPSVERRIKLAADRVGQSV